MPTVHQTTASAAQVEAVVALHPTLGVRASSSRRRRTCPIGLACRPSQPRRRARHLPAVARVVARWSRTALRPLQIRMSLGMEITTPSAAGGTVSRQCPSQGHWVISTATGLLQLERKGTAEALALVRPSTPPGATGARCHRSQTVIACRTQPAAYLTQRLARRWYWAMNTSCCSTVGRFTARKTPPEVSRAPRL
jgi:hypothetical protein